MKQIAWIVLSWFMVMSSIVIASEQPSCAGKPLSEVHTLTALPNEVNSLLGQTRAGMDSIADRDGKFNATDVVDVRLPMSRFVIAGLNSSCVLVAVERGGFTYTIELLMFELNNGKWQVVQRRDIGNIPQSLQELVAPPEPKHNYKPPQGFVPDAATAIKIAIAVWDSIYGEDTIARERPFTAVLLNGIWTVQGSLPKDYVGGVAIAEIAKIDGRVIRVSHGQ